MSTAAATPKANVAEKLSKAQILEELANGSTDESLYVQLKALNASEHKVKEARKTAVATLVKSMGDHQITLSELVENNAFTKEELLKEARAYYPQFGKAPKTPKGSADGTAPKVANTPKATGQELVKINVPNAKGRGTTIKEDSDKPAVFGAGFKYLKGMKGNLKDNFLSFAVTPEALAWMKDAKQEAWLNSWIGYISRDGKKA
jgi:hypothetical protein